MPLKFESLKILVVENIDLLGNMIETVLEAANLQHVFQARNSEHAIVIYKVHKHDVLIVDLDINTEGGIELTRKIRALSSDVPVILMASYANDEAIEKAKSIGINDLLIKPFSFDDLMNHMRYVMK